MKNMILNFIQKNSESKAKTMKMRKSIHKMVFDEMTEQSYNPKSARHKSLKVIGYTPTKSL
jgi:hypothetical protein